MRELHHLSQSVHHRWVLRLSQKDSGTDSLWWWEGEISHVKKHRSTIVERRNGAHEAAQWIGRPANETWTPWASIWSPTIHKGTEGTGLSDHCKTWMVTNWREGWLYRMRQSHDYWEAHAFKEEFFVWKNNNNNVTIDNDLVKVYQISTSRSTAIHVY